MQDKKYFLITLALMERTQEELDFFVSEMKKVVKKYTKAGKISDQFALEKELSQVIDVFYELFVDDLTTAGKAVGKLKAQEALDTLVPELQRTGNYRRALELYNQVRSYSEANAKRMLQIKNDGLTLDIRLKTIKAGTEKTIRNIIENAMKEGKGAKEIAKLLEQYISPVGTDKIAPYDEYRKRFGRPKNYKVKGVPAGTVQYNALRIARTETANVYREATFRFYEGKDYIKGFKRYLSNRHTVYDECDVYAKKLYKTKEEVPRFHPQCLCDVRAVPITYEELLELAREELAVV